MLGLDALVLATREARERTGDRTIGTRVQGGLVQVVRVTCAGKGRTAVAEVSAWLTITDAVVFLGSMR